MVKFLERGFSSPSSRKRTIFFILTDTCITVLSLYLSFLLRFDFQHVSHFWMIPPAVPVFVLVKISTYAFFHIYRFTWRYVSVHDLVVLAKAALVAQGLLMLLIGVFLDVLPFWGLYFSMLRGFPRSIFIIDGFVSFAFLAGLRISKRVYMEVLNKKTYGKGLKTIVIGAGNIGETVIRDLIRQRFEHYYPVAMLDDDQAKIGLSIHGVKVIGKIDILGEAVSKLRAQALIIAIPSLDYRDLRKIYEYAMKSGVKTVKIVPSMYLQQNLEISAKNLEDIKIEDLIGRHNISIEYEQIENFLKGKDVLVTGAGGSIGSEIVMQVCSFCPGNIILLDSDETELHEMELRIKSKDGGNGLGKAHFIVADIRDRDRIDAVFNKFKPHVVFHSAAYKHVPMMEGNPEEAVKVNILGTYNLAWASVSAGVEKFIMISTDKVVNPTSIMGATKKIAEQLCKAFNNDSEGTAFVSVRFGNVLGSRGSLLPLFLRQIKEGGPLTVTDREMKRYFMTIPEAVSLVLQASVIGKGGEILLLDMGEPVKIVTLAEELIKIHGLKPYEDIPITFTGIRPGENLFEELLMQNEKVTRHEKVFVTGNSCEYSIEQAEEMLAELRELLSDNVVKDKRIKSLLEKHINIFECGGKG